MTPTLHDVLHLPQVAALLVAYVAHKDTLCLIAYAIECELHDGARALLRHSHSNTVDGIQDPNPDESLLILHCAAAYGFQNAVMRCLSCGGVREYVDMELAMLPLTQTTETKDTTSQQNPLFAADVLHDAATRGDQHTVAWLMPRTQYEPHIAMAMAASRGHLAVAHRLSSSHGATEPSQSPCQLESSQWLLNDHGDVLCGAWTAHSVGGCNQYTYFAAQGHGLAPVRKRGQHTVEDAVNHCGYTGAMDVVAGHGDLELLKAMHEDPLVEWSCTDRAIVEAAAHGHLLVLQWLVENRKKKEEDNHDWLATAMDGAAHHGHLAILQWLCDAYNPSWQPTASSVVVTLEGGHVAILQWLSDKVDLWSLPGLPSRVQLVEAASVSADRLRVLQWLETTKNIRTVTSAAMSLVLSHGDVRTAQWLADPMGDGEHLAHWDWIVAKWMSYEFALWQHGTMARAALRGHVEIVTWLAQAGAFHKVETTTLWQCARRGHLEIVAFVLQNRMHQPKDLQFLPQKWSTFHDAIVDNDDDDYGSSHVECHAWHRLACDPAWAKPYVALWLQYSPVACHHVAWLRQWAWHCGHRAISRQLGEELVCREHQTSRLQSPTRS